MPLDGGHKRPYKQKSTKNYMFKYDRYAGDARKTKASDKNTTSKPMTATAKEHSRLGKRD